MQLDRKIKQAVTRVGIQEFAQCENQITTANLSSSSLITSIPETKILDTETERKITKNNLD